MILLFHLPAVLLHWLLRIVTFCCCYFHPRMMILLWDLFPVLSSHVYVVATLFWLLFVSSVVQLICFGYNFGYFVVSLFGSWTPRLSYWLFLYYYTHYSVWSLPDGYDFFFFLVLTIPSRFCYHLPLPFATFPG